MKLKYYLRGLGIGIVVTAVIMGILSSKSNISDAEIIERAHALGMTENGVLSELQQTETDEKTESLSQEATEETFATTEAEVQSTETASEEISTIVNQTEVENSSEAMSSTEEDAEKKTTADVASDSTNVLQKNTDDKIQIVIKSGESSDIVSSKLYAAGLVKSATDYDNYLCANGYANKIAAGTHEIPKNATEEEIANILCNR